MTIPHLEMVTEISAYFNDLAKKVGAGEEICWEDICRHVQDLAGEKYGCLYGVPLPSMHDIHAPMVLAWGTPLREILRINNARTAAEEELRSQDPRIHIRNSWHQLGDHEIVVLDTPDKRPTAWPQPMAGSRLRLMLDSFLMRLGSQQTAEAELKAVDALKGKLNASQYRSYILTGGFPERSPRSDVHYIFRKGLPTLALRFDRPDGGGRLLAALCCHPMGYYAHTMCGIMVPTDEVIANLLLLRADERKFWSKSGQWHAWDVRSGL